MAAERRTRRGIRVQVTAVASVAVLAVLVVVGALLLSRQRAGLVGQLDDALAADAERLAGQVASGANVPLAGDDRVVAVERADGTVVASIDGDRADDPTALVAALGTGDDDERDVRLDGERWRVVTADDDGSVVVHVGAPLEDVDEAIAELRRSLLWIVPVAALAIAVVVWVTVGRTLRPVERMRRRVDTIGGADLHQRVPVPATGDEIARLATTMNAMLERLERSTARQQRFVADAAHELRTPLTRMRAELEADAHDPAGADADATRRSQLQEIEGLQRMIEDLLVLARSDAGGALVRRAPVDVDDLVLEEVRSARAVARGAVVLDTTGVSAAQVDGDAPELRRVVRNLLDNACRHAADVVTVQLAERDGTATLVVADDGPGIPPARVAEAFERFARLDDARGAAAGGTGLGLAIVADIVRRHGGEVAVDASPAGGARFTVTLPRRGERPA